MSNFLTRKFDQQKIDYQEQYDKCKESFSEGNGIASAMQNILDKSYYTTNGNPAEWKFPNLPSDKSLPMQWLRIAQLPTGEIGTVDNYRVKERVQGLMNTMHGLCERFAFLLLREDGFTTLYMGVYSQRSSTTAKNSLWTAAQVNLPGVKTETVSDNREVSKSLTALEYCGLVTGQPSIRWDERENPLQTLDKLAGGLRAGGIDNNFALLILAEPISDTSVKTIIETTNSFKSDLSELRRQTLSVSVTDSKSNTITLGASGSHGSGKKSDFPQLAKTHIGVNIGKSSTTGIALVHGASSEKVNFEVEYGIGLLDKLIKRLEQGRNQGFWNSSIYVLASSSSAVDLVTSTAKSIYAGQDTYMEPLRTFNFGNSSTVHSYITGMQFLPFPIDNEIRLLGESNADDWHMFGRYYQMLSTPINTEELSIVMSLPRKETAGIAIKKDAVEFSTNPTNSYGMRTFPIGDILSMGAPNGHRFDMEIDQLNGHAAIFGINGSGKSFTDRFILLGVMKYNIPFLVLDPVKLDYVRWADDYNQKHKDDPNFKPIIIYAPGLSAIPGIKTPITPLRMNPFKPYAAKGCPLNISAHKSSLMALLRSTMAMGDFLPMLLNEAVCNMLSQVMGKEVVDSNSVDPNKDLTYPVLSDLKFYAKTLLADRKYSKENTDNFNAAIETRINSLTSGWKKNFFEAQDSTPAEDLFENNAVICLAGVSDNMDKAFLMALILTALNEYRNSCYMYNETYRKDLEANRDKYKGKYLCHYTVVEEAHRILQVRNSAGEGSNAQTIVADMFCNMLSEIRETGEGLMIVDQYPSRLIPDAIKNTNLKIIHKLQAEDDRRILSNCMSLNDEQSRLLTSLDVGEAIVYSGQDNSARWLHIG